MGRKEVIVMLLSSNQGYKFSLAALVFIFVLSFFAGGSLAQTISIVPNTVNLPPGGLVTLTLEIHGFTAGVGPLTGPAVQVQVGTGPGNPGIDFSGALPNLEVIPDSLTPVGDWQILGSAIDNGLGYVNFYAILTGAGIADGPVAQFKVRLSPTANGGPFNINLVPDNIYVRDKSEHVITGGAITDVDGTVNCARFGDVNFDGAVDGTDAMLVLRHVVSAGATIPLLSDEQLQVADVAPERGVPPQAIIDINDAIAIAKYALGLISVLPVMPPPPPGSSPEAASMAAAAGVTELRVDRITFSPNPIGRSHNTAYFTVEGQAISGMKVEIFDLSGLRVWDSGFVAGNTLEWNLMNDRGEALANGVYLYVVTVRGQGGELIRSKARKIVLLR